MKNQTRAKLQDDANAEKLRELEKKALGGAELAEPLEVENERSGTFDTPGVYIGESPRPFGKEN